MITATGGAVAVWSAIADPFRISFVRTTNKILLGLFRRPVMSPGGRQRAGYGQSGSALGGLNFE